MLKIFLHWSIKLSLWLHQRILAKYVVVDSGRNCRASRGALLDQVVQVHPAIRRRLFRHRRLVVQEVRLVPVFHPYQAVPAGLVDQVVLVVLVVRVVLRSILYQDLQVDPCLQALLVDQKVQVVLVGLAYPVDRQCQVDQHLLEVPVVPLDLADPVGRVVLVDIFGMVVSVVERAIRCHLFLVVRDSQGVQVRLVFHPFQVVPVVLAVLVDIGNNYWLHFDLDKELALELVVHRRNWLVELNDGQ